MSVKLLARGKSSASLVTLKLEPGFKRTALEF